MLRIGDKDIVRRECCGGFPPGTVVEVIDIAEDSVDGGFAYLCRALDYAEFDKVMWWHGDCCFGGDAE